MTGALLQLVARGHIDSRLTGNPKFHFLKQCIEDIQTFQLRL